MFRRLFNRESITLLGRWEHRLPEKQKEIKFLYNNLDHCGDKICGDMSSYKIKKKNNTNKDIGSRKITYELFND